MVPMLKATPDNYKCCIMRLTSSSTQGFDFDALIKTFFMVQDVRLVSPDPDPDRLADGEVPVFDMTHVTIWHLLKLSLSTLKLYFKYTQEAHPVRVQAIHVCNCTSFINRIMALIKPLLKPEVAARFQFHTPGSDTIFKFIPRDMLPEEYGGDAGPMSAMKEFWTKKFIERRSVSLKFWIVIQTRNSCSVLASPFVSHLTCRDYVMNDANWIASMKEDQNNNEAECD
jgi:CRAL/TRIO domain